MIAPFTSDRMFEFDAAPDVVWKTLEQTDRFPVWWRWLRTFETDGVSGLHEGARAECAVRGPLPYAVRFTVALRTVEPERLVDAEVTGDIEGPARLELTPTATGSSARLVWSVRLVDPALRASARVARPLMQWGHDWVVSRGVRAFRVNVLGAD